MFESAPPLLMRCWPAISGGRRSSNSARARSNPRCGAQLVEVLDLLLDNAEHLSFEDFRTVVRRWEHLADEDGTLDDAEANHANRTAGLHEVNGCLDLRASGGRPLDAAEMLGIFERFVEDEFRADVAARTELSRSGCAGVVAAADRCATSFRCVVRIFRTAASMPAGCPGSGAGGQHRVRPRDVRDVARPAPADPVPRRSAAHRPGPGRCETDSGIVVPPEHVLQAALLGHVRRVIVDGRVWCSTWAASDACSRVRPGWQPS